MRFRPSALVVYLTARHMLTVLVVVLCLTQPIPSTVDVATALAIALAAFIAGRVVFQAEGETHFDLGGPCAVAAVLLLPPPLCVAALGPSLALAHLIKWGRQTEWPKRWYNFSHHLTAPLATSLVLHAAGVGVVVSLPSALGEALAVVFALLLYYAFDSMGAAALFAVLSRGTLWMHLRQQVSLSALTELGASASGAAVAIVWHANPLLVALFAAPFYTVRTAMAARAGEIAAVRAANHDVLTGLANRRAFMDVLVREEARAQRGGGPPSLIAIDLDGFKPINDTYGHAAGDAALKAIAAVLEAECRSYDVVARFGGDEFALLLPDTTTEGAYAMAENILACIMAAPVVPNAEAYRMSASLGVATLFQHAETSEALLEVADTALYYVKHGAKCGITVAAPLAPAA